MDKAEFLSGMTTIIVGSIILISIWPITQMVPLIQGKVAAGLILYLLGIVLIKYGIQAADI